MFKLEKILVVYSQYHSEDSEKEKSCPDYKKNGEPIITKKQ